MKYQHIEDKTNWGINSVCQVSNNLIGSVGNDAKLKIWNWKKGNLQKSYLGHGHPIKCICLVKKGEIIATGSAHEGD